MLLKCNFCSQRLPLFGDGAPGQVVECHICRKGIGVTPGQRAGRPRKRWWQRQAAADEPVLQPDSKIPLLNGRAYRLEAASEEMKQHPGTIWAPVSRIKYGMGGAYSYNGREFITVDRDGKPGNASGPEAKLPFDATAQDWYELDIQKFYTLFLHW
jgi:hypothetical protein